MQTDVGRGLEVVLAVAVLLLLLAPFGFFGLALYSSLGHGWWPPVVVVAGAAISVLFVWVQAQGDNDGD